MIQFVQRVFDIPKEENCNELVRDPTHKEGAVESRDRERPWGKHPNKRASDLEVISR